MQMNGEVNPRVMVARFANGGIGDHLSCLIGSWWYAKCTGRLLLIDWRGSRYNSRGSDHNCFIDLFGQPTELAGVPTVCDERIRNWPYQGPFFPQKWDSAKLHGVSHVKHTADEVTAVNDLVESTDERPEPTVAFNQAILSSPPRDEVQKLLLALPFSKAIQSAATEIWSRELGSAKGLAIHIRHGNGENIGHRAAYWLDPWRFSRQLWLNLTTDIHRAGVHGPAADNMPDSLIRTQSFSGSELRFVKDVVNKVRAYEEQIPGAKPMLFCDSKAVATQFRELDPDIVIPPKQFGPINQGPLHGPNVIDKDTDPNNVARVTFEMAVEMELIRRCSALIYMNSGFTIFSKYLLDDNRLLALQPSIINRLMIKIADRMG